jgi:hypothetical protein
MVDHARTRGDGDGDVQLAELRPTTRLMYGRNLRQACGGADDFGPGRYASKIAYSAEDDCLELTLFQRPMDVDDESGAADQGARAN